MSLLIQLGGELVTLGRGWRRREDIGYHTVTLCGTPPIIPVVLDLADTAKLKLHLGSHIHGRLNLTYDEGEDEPFGSLVTLDEITRSGNFDVYVAGMREGQEVIHDKLRRFQVRGTQVLHKGRAIARETTTRAFFAKNVDLSAMYISTPGAIFEGLYSEADVIWPESSYSERSA